MKSLLQAIDTQSRRPLLRTVNGIGFRLSGWIADTDEPRIYYKIHWFTVLFIPIIPCGVYALDRAESTYPNYLIFGRVPMLAFLRSMGRKALKPFFNSYIEGTTALAVFLAVLAAVALFASFVRHAFR